MPFFLSFDGKKPGVGYIFGRSGASNGAPTGAGRFGALLLFALVGSIFFAPSHKPSESDQKSEDAASTAASAAEERIVPRGSEKPSFDCAQAKTAAARLICADGDLARLDGELSAAFQKRRAQISTPDQSRFTAEQLAWIRDRNTRCELDGKSSTAIEVLASFKPCMVSAFQERITLLAQIDPTAAATAMPSQHASTPGPSPASEGARCESIMDKQSRISCFERAGIPVVDCSQPRNADDAAFCRQIGH